MSLNPPIQVNWLHVNHCSTFWLLQKLILQKIKRPSYKGYLAFIEIQLSIMAARKINSLSVLRLSAEAFVAKFKRIIGIIVA
jgi:hypothetical protein